MDGYNNVVMRLSTEIRLIGLFYLVGLSWLTVEDFVMLITSIFLNEQGAEPRTRRNMEDVLTEIPPPSRFFKEDLNNFALPSPPLPSPFLSFSCLDKPLRPSLLIIAISSSSLSVFHHVSTKTLVGTLILPEIPLSGNSIEPSLRDKSCNIYALNDADNSVLLVSVQYSVSAERSYSVAKLMIGEQIIPERVLILDSVQSRNFRGKLSPDETFAFKLETSSEREGLSDGSSSPPLLKSLKYFPSGSMVDGLAAALLSRCQMRSIRGSLCVSWPEFGSYGVSLVKSILKEVLPSLEFSLNNDGEDEYFKWDQIKAHPFDSELYT